MEGRSRSLGHAPQGLLLALQVLDSGGNDFGLVLRAVIVPDLAVVQVAIDPDEPAFGAFLHYILGQVPEGDNGGGTRRILFRRTWFWWPCGMRQRCHWRQRKPHLRPGCR